jgi:hypothetical protein
MTKRELTNQQREINPDPAYWDWFDAWWDKDYSWEGLKKHKTENGSQTLREYYERFSEYGGMIVNFNGKAWLILHAPLHDPDGNGFEETSKRKNQETNEFPIDANLQLKTHYGVVVQESHNHALLQNGPKRWINSYISNIEQKKALPLKQKTVSSIVRIWEIPV